MKLYLDDDSASKLLTLLLTRAGHDVQVPKDVGLAGDDDAVYLTHAIDADRVLRTHNYHDCANLHNLVGKAQGHHPGILVICKENNPKRDLQARDIVRAIGKLQASGLPFPDEFHNLNQWR